ncbi:MAG: hypothetical protein ACKVP7_01995 [Hyphomicrobiaceae bacterium]
MALIGAWMAWYGLPDALNEGSVEAWIWVIGGIGVTALGLWALTKAYNTTVEFDRRRGSLHLETRHVYKTSRVSFELSQLQSLELANNQDESHQLWIKAHLVDGREVALTAHTGIHDDEIKPLFDALERALASAKRQVAPRR